MADNKYNPEDRNEGINKISSSDEEQENSEFPRETRISEEDYQFLLNELNIK